MEVRTEVTPGSRVLAELSREESLQLLAGVPLGRLVFTDRALPAIRPVNHAVVDGRVVIRTHSGASVLPAAAQGVVVAYEADAIDPVTRTGWCVVVTGVARLVRDPATADRYRRLVRSWLARPLDQVIEVGTELVTGFRLVPGPDVGPDRGRAW